MSTPGLRGILGIIIIALVTVDGLPKMSPIQLSSSPVIRKHPQVTQPTQQMGTRFNSQVR